MLAAVLDWSAEAGLTADPSAVREALDAHEVGVENTLANLIRALGIA